MDPKIGVTLGDPAGCGPEVVWRALEEFEGARVRLYGPEPLVRKLSSSFDYCEARPTSHDLEGIEVGAYSKQSGAAAVAALEAAIEDLRKGEIGALVTGPISKSALRDACLPYPGQTEWVASALQVRKFAMMMAGPRLKVTVVTRHLALRDVPSALEEGLILDTIILTRDFLREIEGLENPVIGVLGLNPHASDHGMFGDEEERLIEPAIQKAQEAGIEAFGPLPADAAFPLALGGHYHALVAMYHDQGLGPFKAVHFEDGVNVTLGLPRLRCSPDHGPAFDIAGRGKASHKSMLEALRLARKACNKSHKL